MTCIAKGHVRSHLGILETGKREKPFIQTTSTSTGQNIQGLLRAVPPPNTNSFIFNFTNGSHVLQRAELQVSSEVLIPSERSKVWTFQRRGVDTGDSNKVSDTFTQENLTQCDVLRLNQLISLMEPLRSGKHHLHVTWDSYNGLLESPCNWVVEFPTRNKRPGLTDHRTFGEAYPLYRKTHLVYKGRAVLV